MRFGSALLAAATCLLLAAPAGALAPPKVGVSANVQRVQGTVLVKGRSGRFVPLSRSRHVLMGAVIDATRGQVRVIAASNTKGGRQSGVFYDGSFRITQRIATSPVVDLELRGGSFAGCRGALARSAGSRTTVRRLWGRARGRFRTRGRYSAATVRGTKWLTQDLCQGTATSVAEGVVQASFFGTTVTLHRGNGFITYCSASGDFCTSVQSRAGDHVLRIGGFPFRGSYRLCVTGPDAGSDCGTFPFRRGRFDIYSSDVSWRDNFPSRGSGDYSVHWELDPQTPLGPDLFFAVPTT
jgi:hypothetical protein